jgi:prepilin-type N-terminal cleavage/methylation domain-containing protein
MGITGCTPISILLKGKREKITVDQQCKGFTFIELLVVLSIITVLTVASVSNFIAELSGYRLRGATAGILTTLQRARLRAVKENSFVVVLFDPDGNGRLDGDYMAFVDNGNDTSGDWVWQPEEGEALIVKEHLPEGVRFTRTSFSRNRLRFNSQGHLMGINRSIFLKNSDEATKKITVYASGNSRAF